jgi:hypothetical protein
VGFEPNDRPEVSKLSVVLEGIEQGIIGVQVLRIAGNRHPLAVLPLV